MLLQEVPNVTFKSIRMMSNLIYNAISQKYMKKGEKTITARLLSVSSAQEDSYISNQSQN